MLTIISVLENIRTLQIIREKVGKRRRFYRSFLVTVMALTNRTMVRRMTAKKQNINNKMKKITQDGSVGTVRLSSRRQSQA